MLADVCKPLPGAAAPLWDVLLQLSGTRQVGGGAITCAEIESWSRLQRVRLTPWEVDTLLACDRAARSVPVERKDLSE